MIQRNERRIATLCLRADYLLELLCRHGYLAERFCGPDVRVVAIVADSGVTEEVKFVLEGDSLGSDYTYRGHLHPEIVHLAVPQRGHPHGDDPDELPIPLMCGQCHPGVYEKWRVAAHSKDCVK